VDGWVHGVGADGALEQLVYARGRRYHQRPRPRYRPGGTSAVGDDDHVDGGGGGTGGGGGFEEGAGELGRGDGGGVVVILHAVGVGHALDAVQLHAPQQIERNLDQLVARLRFGSLSLSLSLSLSHPSSRGGGARIVGRGAPGSEDSIEELHGRGGLRRRGRGAEQRG